MCTFESVVMIDTTIMTQKRITSPNLHDQNPLSEDGHTSFVVCCEHQIGDSIL